MSHLLSIIPVFFYIAGIYKRVFLIAGLVMQTLYITMRTINIGRIPLVGPHDTLIFLSAAIIAISIPVSLRLIDKRGFNILVSLLALVFTISANLFSPHNMPLPPVLRTLWFELHVILSFVSYGFFGIAFVLGILYVKDKSNNKDLERSQYVAILTGYGLFSLSMIFGGIWAFLAWGTYWLWTPKELWTTILWLFYGLYFHARLRQKWQGRPSVFLGTSGFIVVLFTYLGVSLLMKSSHTF